MTICFSAWGTLAQNQQNSQEPITDKWVKMYIVPKH